MSKAPPEHAAPKKTRRDRRDDRRSATVDEASEAKPTKKKRSILWRSRRLFLLVFVVFMTACSGFAFAVWQAVELPPNTPPLKQTTFICSNEVQADCNEHNSIAQLAADEDRVNVSYDQIPSVLVQAVVATEDKEFFVHKGVDPAGVTRAFVANIRDDKLGQQGGSTITQQYVKNAYLTADRSLERKMKEAVLSIKLERELTKKEILERYLNTIYFGRRAYGVKAAARAYFGKDVEQLGLPESAYLAGIIRSPGTSDANLPASDPDAASNRQQAENRRHDVLRQMKDLNFISQEQFDAVDKMGWEYVVPRTVGNSNGQVKYRELGSEYFIEYVKRQLTDPNGPYKFSEAQLFEGGLRIYTTIDWNMQKMAYDTIGSTLNVAGDPAASIVSLDTAGRVKVMVGGKDFKTSQVNLAAGSEGGGGGRQPGSSWKPIALAQALSGPTPVPLDWQFDAPGVTSLKLKNGDIWRVGNYGDGGLGKLDLVEMTKQSSNTAYAQLIELIGPDKVAELAGKMGVKSKVQAVPAMVLGTEEVSVLEMASVYSTFMDNGEHVEPTVVSRVDDAQGRPLYQARAERTRVLAPDTVQKVNWILSQVVEDGTATAAKFGQPVAGKTGTTENYRDAWFVGYTCELTTAVWMGYPGPETKYMDNVHGKQVAGGTFPAQMFSNYMAKAGAGLRSCPFPPPVGVSTTVPAPVAPPNTGAAPPSTATRPSVAPSTAAPSTTARPAPSSTAAPSTTARPAPSSTAAPSTTDAPPVPPSSNPP